MYRIVAFDVKAAAKQGVIIAIMSLVLTLLGRVSSEPAWVKEGENFVLFFLIFVGTLLYGFSVATVFQAGQTAWYALVEAVEMNESEKVEKLMRKKPDIFPTILVVLGWLLLTLSSLYLQVPKEMSFLMFVLMTVITTPVFLAFDYWGYTSGIKRIEKLR